MNCWTRTALVVGTIAWLVGWGLVLAFPQFPDGDSTAQAQFVAWYGAAWQHYVRGSWVWNLFGALFAWGMVAVGLAAWRQRVWGRILLVGVVLLFWSGWAATQTLGWSGELFLPPNTPVRLSDSQTFIAFDQFLIPPAPDDQGRELRMHLVVQGQPYEVSASNPYHGNGWTITPRWYGAVVTHPLLTEPLYIGASGIQEIALNDGQRVKLTISVEDLTVSSDPPISGWKIHHYAIVGARYDPLPFFPRY